MRVTAFAPISAGNFIVGFDVLGAALQPVDGAPLGDWVTIEDANESITTIAGPFAHALPGEPSDNIVHTCRLRYEQELSKKGLAARPNRLSLHKALPVGSGLGSSAASAVAALQALNLFYSSALAERELLILAGEMEGRISGSIHYDNVAPALLGGLQLLVPDERLSIGLPLPPWHLVLYHPGIEVATRTARAVLPKHYDLHTVTAFGQRLAAFVQAAMAQQWQHAAALLSDELIEAHRAPLVPGFVAAKAAALGSGALAFSLSGAGPTCMAVCPDAASAARVRLALDQAFPVNAARKAWICRFDAIGARPWPVAVPEQVA